MAEFLFEILSEEIPARMQVRAGADLSKALKAGLETAGLTVENAQVFTGPRRLTFVADLPLRSPDVSEERKGPRVGSPCLLYTSPSPRDATLSRMPSSA